MIHSGRRINKTNNTTGIPVAAKLTAIIGGVVFALFLISSVREPTADMSVYDKIGEGAYQVFATADEEDVAAVEDGSVWSYLESVIAELI